MPLTVQPAETSSESLSATDLSTTNDVPMDRAERILVMPSSAHTVSPDSNDVKRAKYDETVDMEIPSTSYQEPASTKAESIQMEVQEEPEIIEVIWTLLCCDL